MNYNTHDSIVAFQAEEKAFATTPIGAAFNRFKSLHATAWVQDTEDSFNDKNRKSTKEAWDKLQVAERELKQIINQMLTK